MLFPVLSFPATSPVWCLNVTQYTKVLRRTAMDLRLGHWIEPGVCNYFRLLSSEQLTSVLASFFRLLVDASWNMLISNG